MLTVTEKRVRGNVSTEIENHVINIYPSVVQDIVYQGVYTKYWIKSSDLRIAALKPHSRFLLDQEPITWNDKVFVWWHPDDGYMVEAKQ